MANSKNPQLIQEYYSWTSLQRPPWGQKKVAIVGGLNESQCMDSLRTADVFPVVEATTGNTSAVRRLMYGLSAKKSGR